MQNWDYNNTPSLVPISRRHMQIQSHKKHTHAHTHMRLCLAGSRCAHGLALFKMPDWINSPGTGSIIPHLSKCANRGPQWYIPDSNLHRKCERKRKKVQAFICKSGCVGFFSRWVGCVDVILIHWYIESDPCGLTDKQKPSILEIGPSFWLTARNLQNKPTH